MTGQKNTFGEILRELRLQAGFGLRRFAELIDWEASNLSALEHGRRRPPTEPDKLQEIADALGLAQHSEDWTRFYNAAREDGELPVDVQHMANRESIPVLLRTIDNQKLTDEQLDKLIKRIKQPQGE